MIDQMATLRASIDNSGTKSQLVIDGSVMVYASDNDIDLQIADPQGINPTICLIYAVVAERPSPMKGVMKSFGRSFVYSDPEWTSVQVVFRYDPEAGSEGRIQSISADIEGV